VSVTTSIHLIILNCALFLRVNRNNQFGPKCVTTNHSSLLQYRNFKTVSDCALR